MQYEYWPKYAGLYITYNPCWTKRQELHFFVLNFIRICPNQFYENADENSIYVSFVFHLTISTLRHIYSFAYDRLYFEPSQIATVTNCDTTVAICDLLQFVIKSLTAQTESNNTENVCWVLGRVPRFTFDINMKSFIFAILALFHCYICLCVCISVIMSIIDLQRKPCWYCPTSMCTCFLYWGVYPLALRTWIWEVAFWTVTKCNSHKMRQFRNPCRRILWFVAFCDHGRDGTKWVQ